MKYMIIENDLEIISFYDKLGVDRIFLDLEINGKKERQGHLDTVISESHKISDIKKISNILNKSELLVRINPIYHNSKIEIDKCIDDGADIIMLPMFKTNGEVSKFLNLIDNRVKSCLLLETKEAFEDLDNILNIDGIDEIHIGLNDLHLSLNMSFIFEPLVNGVVETIINKIKSKGIAYGFGGISTIDGGKIPGKMILFEHVRLNSEMVILSRDFKNLTINDASLFEKEFLKLKNLHEIASNYDKKKLDLNREKLTQIINNIN